VSILDELLAKVRGYKISPAESREQTLDFAYGNLAASSNHKPSRIAFKVVALERGMTEAEFDVWAADRQWWL
jgi:hypothetical protein